MNAATDSLLNSLQRDEPHTDEEYEAVCKVLLEQLKRTLDTSEEDWRDIRRLRDESRATIERIRAI